MGRFLDEGGALNQEWTLTQGNKVLDLITCSWEIEIQLSSREWVTNEDDLNSN